MGRTAMTQKQLNWPWGLRKDRFASSWRRPALKTRPWTGGVFPTVERVIAPLLRRLSTVSFSLRHDTGGAVAAVFAVTIVGIIGFGALGIETGLWFSERRQLQTAADAAAVSGAFQLANSAPLATIQAAGTAMAVNNKFVNAAPNTISISEGNWNGTTFTSGGAPLNAVQAVLSTPRATLFAAVALPTVTIGAQAVAIVNTSFGHPCILALDNGVSSKTNPGISIAGSASVNTGPNCMIASNAQGDYSIEDQGGAGNNITAQDLYTVGAVNYTGSPNFTPAPGLTPISGAAPVPDPYSSLPISPSGPSQTVSGSTLSPGIYNGGMNLSGGGPYTLQPGTYYVENGDFTIKNAQVNGSGVTIVLTGSSPSKIGSVQIGPNATGSLTEPTSGVYSGILFYQDRTASGGGNNCKSPANSINANAGIALEGVIYMPSMPLCFQGTPTTMAGNCLQLVAWQVSIQGNPSLNDTGCPPGTTTPGITNVVLAK